MAEATTPMTGTAMVPIAATDFLLIRGPRQGDDFIRTQAPLGAWNESYHLALESRFYCVWQP
jgi:hypothetical protein